MCILISFLSNAHEFKIYKSLLDNIIQITANNFRIGKLMNIVEWDKFFRSFNYEISEYNLIFENGKILIFNFKII